MVSLVLRSSDGKEHILNLATNTGVWLVTVGGRRSKGKCRSCVRYCRRQFIDQDEVAVGEFDEQAVAKFQVMVAIRIFTQIGFANAINSLPYNLIFAWNQL